METLSPNILKDYIKTMTQSKNKSLSILGKNQAFVQAFNTTQGTIFMELLVSVHAECLDRMAKHDVTDFDRGRYAGVQEIVNKCAEKFYDYAQKVKEIEREVMVGKNGS